MYIKVALIISVILQFSAAIIAISLVRRTRTNIAWWLISAGFLLMAFRRVVEVLQVYNSESRLITSMLNSWLAVLISLFMLISLLFIRRIFNIQKRIDELKKQSESRVLSAIIKTEEKERQHFAKELHDGLGPLLSAVKMAISTSLYKKENIQKELTAAEKLVDESITTLKDISNKLSPHILNNFGVLKAIKSFVNALKMTDGPAIHLQSNIADKRFGYNIEVVLYRVVCELISNTIRHARAKNITIEIVLHGQRLCLEYSDDGVGFNADRLPSDHTGLGYSNIHSRIHSLNGNYTVQSKPGQGMSVKAEIMIP
ncbi:MAG: sensor histidine kinase [Bacteroidota bacterium]|nr:MAG: sensor histidine kinase [Bacteroidota bacterium]